MSEMSKMTMMGKFTDAGRNIHYKSKVRVHCKFAQTLNIVHAFTCAVSQYVHFSAHAKLHPVCTNIHFMSHNNVADIDMLFYITCSV